MSKQIACLLTGLSLAMSSVGCCCLGGLGYGANRCNPCGGCPTGGGAGYYPPATTMQTYDGSQTAYASGFSQTAAIPGAIVGAPIIASPGGGYTNTVMVPTNALPTY